MTILSDNRNLCYFATGYLNDLFVFDFASKKWSDITGVVNGEKSVEKFSCRLIFENGKLYAFGGANDAGILMKEDSAFSASFFS
jgi:hypothetical protein